MFQGLILEQGIFILFLKELEKAGYNADVKYYTPHTLGYLKCVMHFYYWNEK